MRSIYFLFCISTFLFACQSEGSQTIIQNEKSKDSVAAKQHQIWEKEKLEDTSRIEEEATINKKPSKLEQKMIAAGLVDIQKIDSTIHIDVKYATKDNFMGQVLYKNYPKVYLQKVVAERLSKAQKALQEIDPTLTLLVFDGTRPRSVQQAMWDALDTIPFSERVKFVSNPANGSIHNYGCAVDLTIANKFSKNPLDMGAGYDDLRKIAYPRHEDRFLKSGALTEVQVQNRKLLRQVMRAGGFWVIQTEWWHFNAFSRKKAKELFEIIE